MKSTIWWACFRNSSTSKGPVKNDFDPASLPLITTHQNWQHWNSEHCNSYQHTLCTVPPPPPRNLQLFPSVSERTPSSIYRSSLDSAWMKGRAKNVHKPTSPLCTLHSQNLQSVARTKDSMTYITTLPLIHSISCQSQIQPWAESLWHDHTTIVQFGIAKTRRTQSRFAEAIIHQQELKGPPRIDMWKLKTPMPKRSMDGISLIWHHVQHV